MNPKEFWISILKALTFTQVAPNGAVDPFHYLFYKQVTPDGVKQSYTSDPF